LGGVGYGTGAGVLGVLLGSSANRQTLLDLQSILLLKHSHSEHLSRGSVHFWRGYIQKDT